MNAKLQKAKKSYEKKLRSIALTKEHKQNIKSEQMKVCWILNNLNWYHREIARPLGISHHTVKAYIKEVENDPYLRETASSKRPEKFEHKRKDMGSVEYNIQSNQSFGKNTLGKKHNDDY